jgi:hypothetical protein
MNAEILAAAISNLLFGFVIGLAVEAFHSKIQIEMLNESIQNGVETMFKKDKRIDELTSDLETIRSQYKQLYEAKEVSRRAFENVRNLPPPSSPLVRCEHYVDDDDDSCLPRIIEFPNPQTPKSTCVPSSTG